MNISSELNERIISYQNTVNTYKADLDDMKITHLDDSSEESDQEHISLAENNIDDIEVALKDLDMIQEEIQSFTSIVSTMVEQFVSDNNYTNKNSESSFIKIISHLNQYLEQMTLNDLIEFEEPELFNNLRLVNKSELKNSPELQEKIFAYLNAVPSVIRYAQKNIDSYPTIIEKIEDNLNEARKQINSVEH